MSDQFPSFLDWIGQRIGNNALSDAGYDPSLIRFWQGAQQAGQTDLIPKGIDPQAIINAVLTRNAGNIGVQLAAGLASGIKDAPLGAKIGNAGAIDLPQLSAQQGIGQSGVGAQPTAAAVSVSRSQSPSEQIASRLVKYAKSLGYSTDRDSSRLSGSEYVGLSHPSIPDDGLKVRISDHDLPPSYGSPGDYDIHVGVPRMQSSNWADVIADLAKRAGQPVPAPVQSVLSKAQAASDAQKRIEMMSGGYQESLLNKTYPAEWKQAISLQGADRSAARRALAARYESENPGVIPRWAPYLAPEQPPAPLGVPKAK